MTQWDETWLAQQLQKPGYQVVGADTVPRLPSDTPEGALLTRVRALAKVNGFETYHTYRSTKSEPGFPDLVLCNGVSLLIYELKSNDAKVTKEQAYWLSLLAHTAKVECGIWHPRDWPQIVERLTRRSRA